MAAAQPATCSSPRLSVRPRLPPFNKSRFGAVFRDPLRRLLAVPCRVATPTRAHWKVSNLETNLPRVERRVAEISGNLRGLSDEVQCQIRRIDQADSRLWDWRHHLEEEIRAKFNEIDQHFQQVTSSMRVQKTMADDQFKKFTQRLHKLEGLVDERVTASEETLHIYIGGGGRLRGSSIGWSVRGERERSGPEVRRSRPCPGLRPYRRRSA